MYGKDKMSRFQYTHKRSLRSFLDDVVPRIHDDLSSSYRCAIYVRLEEASASIRFLQSDFRNARPELARIAIR